MQEHKLAKEAQSRERQARRDEKRRLGQDPNTSSMQMLSDEDEDEEEEEDGHEVGSEAAYETFFGAVGAERGEPDVVVIDVD